MKFKFYPIESRIYDFLQFPSLIFKKERLERSDNFDKDIPMDQYFNLINIAEEKFKPFEKDIELYYSEKFSYNYDFIDLMTDVYTFFGYKDEKDYLNMLLNLSEKEIYTSMAYSFLATNENNQDFSDEILKKASIMNKNDLISIIKELPTDPSRKWNLFLIAEAPLKHMKIYVHLMYSLLPIFEEIYLSYEDEVNNHGKHLIDLLNKKGAEGLKEISYSIIDTEIIKNEENSLLISAIEQYAIILSCSGKNSYLLWGLKTEEFFKIKKQINENKINERVHVFKNLGDKTRYEVVKLLSTGVTSTKEIANTLGVSSATISYHLSNLIQAKVIKAGLANDKYNYLVNYSYLEEILRDFKEDIGII